MKTLYYSTTFILLTFVVFLGVVLVWLFTMPFDRNRKVLHRYSRLWAKIMYRIAPWWKVEIEGLENIEEGKAYIILSNHQAMLDIPLLYYLPLDFKWVSKKEVYYIPVFGWVLWMHGDVAIERGGAASAKRMITKADAYLRDGVSVIMFPEGTRSKDGRVHKFMPGAFLLAKRSRVDMLPVVINGNFDAFGKRGIAVPHTFRIKVLPPVKSETYADMRFDKISEKAEEIIRAEHRRMAPQYYKDTQSEQEK